jgi:hypothetical protein
VISVEALEWSMPNWETREIASTDTYRAYEVCGPSLILVETSHIDDWTRCTTIRNAVKFLQVYLGKTYGERDAVEVAKQFSDEIIGKIMRAQE